MHISLLKNYIHICVSVCIRACVRARARSVVSILFFSKMYLASQWKAYTSPRRRPYNFYVAVKSKNRRVKQNTIIIGRPVLWYRQGTNKVIKWLTKERKRRDYKNTNKQIASSRRLDRARNNITEPTESRRLLFGADFPVKDRNLPLSNDRLWPGYLPESCVGYNYCVPGFYLAGPRCSASCLTPHGYIAKF